MRQVTGGPSSSQSRITFCEGISLKQVGPGGREGGREAGGMLGRQRCMGGAAAKKGGLICSKGKGREV